MPFESKTIKKTYTGRMAKKYDFTLPHYFAGWKRAAIEDSSLKSGDRVLVFCCGTGFDFLPILNRIGKEGKIVGVDFSAEMLNQANQKIKENKWENIQLIEADITTFKGKLDDVFDAGVCTLGMSIIPDYQSAYYNLVSYVKKQGEIIIGDMQLASGWLAVLNPITVYFSKKFGGTYKGHQNTLDLYAMMQRELTDVSKKEFLFKSYFYCIGKIR